MAVADSIDLTNVLRIDPTAGRFVLSADEAPYEELLPVWGRIKGCDNRLSIIDTKRLGYNSDKIFRVHSVVHGIDSYIKIDGNFYIITKYINSGTFGIVGVCTDNSGTQFILKRIEAFRDNLKRNVLTEIIIQHIIHTYNPAYAPKIEKVAVNGDVLFLIMEYKVGSSDSWAYTQDCRAENDKVDNEMVNVMWSVATMGGDLYDKYKFIHGDMKPDNLLHLSDGSIMFIDFGFANIQYAKTPQTALVANYTTAGIVQPTRDLAMLAWWYLTFVPNVQDIDSAYPLTAAGMRACLYNAHCNVFDDEYLRGDLSQLYRGDPHPKNHFLAPTRSNVTVPPNMFALVGIGWSDLYRYFCDHNIVELKPENVLIQFVPPAAPHVVPPVVPVAAPVAAPPLPASLPSPIGGVPQSAPHVVLTGAPASSVGAPVVAPAQRSIHSSNSFGSSDYSTSTSTSTSNSSYVPSSTLPSSGGKRKNLTRRQTKMRTFKKKNVRHTRFKS